MSYEPVLVSSSSREVATAWPSSSTVDVLHPRERRGDVRFRHDAVKGQELGEMIVAVILAGVECGGGILGAVTVFARAVLAASGR